MFGHDARRGDPCGRPIFRDDKPQSIILLNRNARPLRYGPYIVLGTHEGCPCVFELLQTVHLMNKNERILARRNIFRCTLDPFRI